MVEGQPNSLLGGEDARLDQFADLIGDDDLPRRKTVGFLAE